MYKIYFKQAIEMLKQNKFFSMISILGTALAIMMIMSIIVTDNVKNINVAPEVNRNRTFYILGQTIKDTITGSMRSGPIQYSIFRDYLSGLKTPERISVVTNNQNAIVNKPGSKEIHVENVKYTNTSFWQIFSFTFLQGSPFSQADVESGIRNAVIRKSLKQKLFKSENALGEIIDINFEPYRIVGIVDDFSSVCLTASGSVWVPYTSEKEYENLRFTLLVLAKKNSDLPTISQEIKDAEKKYDALHAPNTLTFRGPENHTTYSMALRANYNEQVKALAQSKRLKSIFIFLVLLLVPAINLSGLSLSRMKQRMSEIGVRKAFGAKRHIILMQVLYENLITSLIGGVIGLLLSYVIVFQLKEWLLGISESSTIPIDTLVSWPVFLTVFAVCVLLNLLSAGIPAYRASKFPIINSLNQNDQ